MIDPAAKLSVSRQAIVLGISRGSVYYKPRPVSDADLKLMHRIDKLHMEFPFAGSRMLQGLATEREAAGRKVWHDTNLAIAHAPAEGTIARLLGGLEHGDDHHRLAAAEGLAHLRRADLRPYLAERLPRENLPRIRAVLERAIGAPAS
jgi:hypothetical protein